MAAFDETPDRLITIKEVSRRVGLGKTMIYRKIAEGTFPQQYKLSPFAARWSDTEISKWISDVKYGFEGKLRKV